jgi:cholesterol transport system auxiliary component
VSGRLRAAAALALLALLGGCLDGLRRAPPQKQRFMLQLESGAAAPSAPTTGAAAGSAALAASGTAPALAGASAAPALGSLRLERVRVSPVFDHKSFVYRLGENRFETDYYREFFSPPGVLLQEALRQWLASSGLFSVAERGAGPEPRWLLEADLEQLYADLREPAAPRAVLALDVRVRDARTDTLAFEKRYAQQESAADASPDALIAAWNRALGAALGALGGELRTALDSSGSGGGTGAAGAEKGREERTQRGQREPAGRTAPRVR